MVVKINMMRPFCVKHHVGVHFKASVMFTKTNAQKKLIASKLPHYVWCEATFRPSTPGSTR
jgi:hypothetical protein